MHNQAMLKNCIFERVAQEKYIFFFTLQDELAEDDCMILDTGHEIYLWNGPSATDIEIRLSYRSAQVRRTIYLGWKTGVARHQFLLLMELILYNH